eukprot:2059351-Pyramimonas_sp.AAC.1
MTGGGARVAICRYTYLDKVATCHDKLGDEIHVEITLVAHLGVGLGALPTELLVELPELKRS